MHTQVRPVLCLLLLLVLASGCGTASPAPSATPLATAPPSPLAAKPTRPPTATPRPTATAVPPTPTSAIPPTATPEPTATARPTKAPTATRAATATAEIVLTTLRDVPGLLGQEVTIQGTVQWASSFSNGFKFLLDDGTGQATLLMWLNVYDDCWDAPQLMEGAIVQAQGTVGQYEQEWQIEAGYGGDVRVLSPGSPPPMRQVGTMATGDQGTRATIEGTVQRAEAFSQGQRVYLDDGSGTMLVLLWQNVFDRVKDSARLLAPGTRLRASGIIQEYKGTLELVPQLPYNVVIL